MRVLTLVAVMLAVRPASADLLHAPLVIERNQGQGDPRARFVARGPGYGVAFSDDAAALTLRSQTLRLRPLGARRPKLAPEAPLRTVVNYFRGNDPAKWQSAVPAFGKLRYRNVYPGIDLVFYGAGRKLEFDFIVAPGADPGRIRLAVDGAQHLAANRDGDLIVAVDGGELQMRRPRVFQGSKELDGRFLVRDGQVAFAVARWDRKRPLRIDPVIDYASYLGGSGDEAANSVAVDPSGSAYFGGWTASPNFPTLPGSNLQANDEAFLVKLTPAGDEIVFSNVFGGNGGDLAYAVGLDAAGNVFVGGQTASSDFPVTAGAFQKTIGGQDDGFLARFSPSGALLNATYFGGTNSDGVFALAVKSDGSVFFTGSTSDATSFPRVGSLQGPVGDGMDVFIAGLQPGGASPIFSMTFGSASADVGYGIALDPAGAIYVTGQTEGGLPTLSGTFKSSPDGTDCFLAKLTVGSNNDPTVRYGSYLGGSNLDTCSGVGTDKLGRVWVTGWTSSSNFPHPAPSPSPTPSPILDWTGPKGGADGVIARFDPDPNSGLRLGFWAHLGGSGSDTISAMAIHGDYLYWAGYSDSTNLKTSRDAQQPTRPGSEAGIWGRLPVALNADGYLSYFAGSSELLAVAVDSEDSLYAAGTAKPDSVPLIPVRAIQPGFGGGSESDGIVAKLRFNPRSSGPTGDAQPGLTSISPASGPESGGTVVIIGGSNFGPSTSVQFGTSPAASVAVIDSTTLLATTPAHPGGGAVDVVIQSGSLSATRAGGFTYLTQAAAALSLAAVTPSSGSIAGGTRVIILGNQLAPGASVSIGANPPTNVEVLNSNTIVATTAANAAGSVDVVVSNPGGQSATLANGFTFTSGGENTPSLSLVAAVPSTLSTKGGETLLLLGTGFLGDTTLTIDGAPATALLVSSSQLTLTTAAHAAGTATIVATQADGKTASLSVTFADPPKNAASGSCSYGGRADVPWVWLLLLAGWVVARKYLRSFARDLSVEDARATVDLCHEKGLEAHR